MSNISVVYITYQDNIFWRRKYNGNYNNLFCLSSCGVYFLEQFDMPKLITQLKLKRTSIKGKGELWTCANDFMELLIYLRDKMPEKSNYIKKDSLNGLNYLGCAYTDELYYICYFVIEKKDIILLVAKNHKGLSFGDLKKLATIK